MTRTLSGIALGLLVAVIVMMSIEAAGYQLFPLPGFDEAQPTNVAAVPAGALAFTLLAWTIAVFAGAYTAVRISRRRWTTWLIAGAIIAAAGLRFALAGHPLWMVAAGIALPIASAAVARLLAEKSRPPA